MVEITGLARDRNSAPLDLVLTGDGTTTYEDWRTVGVANIDSAIVGELDRECLSWTFEVGCDTEGECFPPMRDVEVLEVDNAVSGELLAPFIPGMSCNFSCGLPRICQSNDFSSNASRIDTFPSLGRLVSTSRRLARVLLLALGRTLGKPVDELSRLAASRCGHSDRFTNSK